MKFMYIVYLLHIDSFKTSHMLETVNATCALCSRVQSSKMMQKQLRTAWLVKPGCECQYNYGPFQVPWHHKTKRIFHQKFRQSFASQGSQSHSAWNLCFDL